MTVATRVRHATLADLPAVDAMRKADGDALGFIPIQRYEHIVLKTKDQYGREVWRYNWLVVCSDAGDLTGFVFASFGVAGSKIEQICVRRDARMMERAARLLAAIEKEAEQRNRPKLKCRVAEDIEANLFWRAMGYRPLARVQSTWLNVRESKSRRFLVHYEKPLCQLGFGFAFDVISQVRPRLIGDVAERPSVLPGQGELAL